MGSFISYLAHQGFVRVAFVPMVMGIMIYVLYAYAAPPGNKDGNNQES